jgi:hypothetical protein
MSGRRLASVLAVSAAAFAVSACAVFSSAVDLKQSIEVTDVSSGWFDAGVVDGKNKLVPSVTFKLKKKADVNLSSVSLNLTYSFVGDTEHTDDVFVQHVPFAGAETAPITVRSKWGYTADPPQTRVEMLANSRFRDLDVQIFAKQSSSQWVELQRVRIARQLLTQ